MIIIGYPGVGKSTLAAKNYKYIDLDPSVFKSTGEKLDNWYKLYIALAEDLSRQGNFVFVSDIKVIRKELRFSKEKVIEVFPSLKLKDFWIRKLKNRYNKYPTERNFSIYNRSVGLYDIDIADMLNEKFDKIIIENSRYELIDLLNKYVSTNSTKKEKEVIISNKLAKNKNKHI